MSDGRDAGIDQNLCYDRATFFKISEHPICDIYPDFLSLEYFADFDGSEGSVRLWCPDRWIQSVWDTEEDKKIALCGNKNKASKSSALNVIDTGDCKEPVDRLKSESDDTVVLSPQRRSFGAGCQAAINKSCKAGAKESEGGRANSSKPRGSRSHRCESRRGHAFNGKSGKDVGNKYRTNAWRSERRSCLSPSSKENLPEWVTEGPKDMYETVELRGFDDDIQSENVDYSVKTSAGISALNGELDKDYEAEKTDEDFHAETDAILNKFLGLARNGYKSRFREFFEQRAAPSSEDSCIDLHKADVGKNISAVDEVPVCSPPHVRSTELDVDKIVDNVRSFGLDQQADDVAQSDPSVSSTASLPGAVHLEDIETTAQPHSEAAQSVQTNFILQELFGAAKSNLQNTDFRDASKAETIHSDLAQQGYQDRTAAATTGTGNSWPGESHGGAAGRGSLAGFPGLYSEHRQTWKSLPLPPECYTGRPEWSSLQPPPVVGRCPQRLPHRRNIPLNVINAMLELKDTPKLNTMKDYMSNIGFKEVFSRSPAPARSRPVDDSSNDSQLGHFSSNITPTSVLRQMHQEKMMHNQNETVGKQAVRTCSGNNAPGPSFLAQASAEANSNLSIPARSVIRPSAWGCPNAQSNVHETVRLGHHCFGQDSWRAFGQQQTSYPVTRPRNIAPQCGPAGVPVLRAHSKHPLPQRMNSRKDSPLITNNVPPFDVGLSQYRNMFMQPQYRFPHYLPGYLPPFPGTAFGGGGRSVLNPNDILCPASIPSDARAVTVEELERHVKAAGPAAHVVSVDSHRRE